jgi:hypothetical protein
MIDFVTIDIESPLTFWEQNPEIKYMEPFSSFYEEENSSDIMKAIYLAYDFKSKFIRAGIPEDTAKRDIAKNFLKDPSFEWGKYSKIIDAYKDKCKTKVQKALDKFEKDAVGFTEYLANLSWEDPEEAEVKSGIYKTVEDYYKKFKDCEALVIGEINEKRFRDGYRLSPAEKMSSKV